MQSTRGPMPSDRSVAPSTAWQLMRPFRTAGFTLFPLKADRTPRDRGWRTVNYTSFDCLTHLGRGGAIGIRLESRDLVIDVDPRNGGVIGFDTLCVDAGNCQLDANAPVVITGRGGFHIFMRKPPAQRVVGNKQGYPGVDFKTEGGYVVAVGSTHNISGAAYRWREGSLSPSGAPNVPVALLELIKRPPARVRDGVGGEITNHQLATLLAAVDPCLYGKDHYLDWIRLSAACHDATAGNGISEWIGWCGGDPEYTGENIDSLTATWDSFESGKAGGVTWLTLLKAVSNAGRRDLLATLDRELSYASFDTDPDGTELPPFPSDQTLEIGPNEKVKKSDN